ncbi:MAG: ATP-NAD kinase family protein [Bermanella sp.]
MFRLGLIVNPMAGLGGTVALKGSDGVAMLALAKGAVPKAGLRTQNTFSVLQDLKDQIQVVTCGGDMGESVMQAMGWQYELVAGLASGADAGSSAAQDTKEAAAKLSQLGVDLLLFAGGDGTARDICEVVAATQPVLGIPAGVKIHSGVYAVTPQAAGEVVRMLVSGELVDLKTQDVKDIDEEAFRANQVRAKLFGEMLVPEAGQFVQSVKQGGMELEDLVLEDMAAYVSAELEDDVLYLVGSGKTTLFVMDYLQLDNTLLGVDAVLNGQLLAADLSEQQILELLAKHARCKMIVSVIGGQGHVFGRGNQQLSAEVIKRVGRENLMILCTKTKLANLEGRPLLVDTGDMALDLTLAGHIEIISGFQDKVLYPIR